MTGFKPKMGTGDKGKTSLLNGKKVRKTDTRIKALALLDDLNCHLGLLRASVKNGRKLKREILSVQNNLFLLSSVIAGVEAEKVIREETKKMEEEIKKLSRKTKHVKKFLIPGEKVPEAMLHIARAKARICEISSWEAQAPEAAVYLNRLSDYFFLLSVLNNRKG